MLVPRIQSQAELSISRSSFLQILGIQEFGAQFHFTISGSDFIPHYRFIPILSKLSLIPFGVYFIQVFEILETCQIWTV